MENESNENKLSIFNNGNFGTVRAMLINDEPLFCLADVCKALGLSAKGVNQRLTDEVISSNPISDGLGREQQALFVNEDGPLLPGPFLKAPIGKAVQAARREPWDGGEG